jgi:hypothetical protein
MCPAGFDNCDTSNPDCETALNSVAHCGACNNVCSAYQICQSSQCSPRYQDSVTIGGANSETGNRVAIDKNGDLYVCGQFNGIVDFDPGPAMDQRIGASGGSLFLSKYGRDGTYKWTRTWDVTAVYGCTVTPDAVDGSLIFTGLFYGTNVDLDPGPNMLPASSPGQAAFVEKLSSDGILVWVQAFVATDAFGSATTALPAVEPDGTIVVAGRFGGTIDFDPGPGTQARAATDHDDTYVVKLDADGNYVWVGTLGGFDYQVPMGLAVTPSTGNIWITGWFDQEVDLDPGTGTRTVANVTANPQISSNTWDIYVDELTPAGNYNNGFTIGGPDYETPKDIAVAADGSVYLVGTFGPSMVDFDPGPGMNIVAGVGSFASPFLLKLTSAGAFQWVHRFDTISNNADVAAVSALTDGGALFAGTYYGDVNFSPTAGGDVRSSTNGRMFVSRLGPDKSYKWTMSPGMDASSNAAIQPTSLAADSTGFIVGGSYRGMPPLNPDSQTATFTSMDYDVFASWFAF